MLQDPGFEQTEREEEGETEASSPSRQRTCFSCGSDQSYAHVTVHSHSPSKFPRPSHRLLYQWQNASTRAQPSSPSEAELARRRCFSICLIPCALRRRRNRYFGYEPTLNRGRPSTRVANGHQILTRTVCDDSVWTNLGNERTNDEPSYPLAADKVRAFNIDFRFELKRSSCSQSFWARLGRRNDNHFICGVDPC